MDKEIFIDANIFLEIFLEDVKSEECKKFLKSLQENGGYALTTDLSKTTNHRLVECSGSLMFSYIVGGF